MGKSNWLSELTFVLPQARYNTCESKEGFMETVQHAWTASQVCLLSLIGSSRSGLIERAVVISSNGNDDISLSCLSLGKAHRQSLQDNTVHSTVQMENGFSSQLRLLSAADAFSPLLRKGTLLYLKQVPVDLSTLNAWPAASFVFTIEDKIRFLTAKLPFLSLPPPMAEQTLIWKCSCAGVWLDSITLVKCKPDPVWLGCSIFHGTQPTCYQLGYSCCNRKQSSWHANFLLLLPEQQCSQRCWAR